MILVYYAECQTEDDLIYIGVFSASKRAEDACQQYHQHISASNHHLLWIGYGDQIRCETPLGAYCITPLDVDWIIPTGKRLYV